MLSSVGAAWGGAARRLPAAVAPLRLLTVCRPVLSVSGAAARTTTGGVSTPAAWMRVGVVRGYACGGLVATTGRVAGISAGCCAGVSRVVASIATRRAGWLGRQAARRTTTTAGKARRGLCSEARAGKESLKAKRDRQLDMLDKTPLPEYHVPPPPPPPSHTANVTQYASLPLAIATAFAVLIYGSYRALNTANIRLAIEEHAPELVDDLEARGVLQPFSTVVVNISREQLAERLFVVLAESDNHISKERMIGLANVLGSDAFKTLVLSVLATRSADEAEYLTADQFIACFAQATVEDTRDVSLYFAVRNAYDIVPLPRKVKAMLGSLYDQCMQRNTAFTVGEVQELCEKLALPFDRDEESAAELAGMAHKHNFLDYFARKFEGAEVASVLVRLKAVLLYAVAHPGMPGSAARGRAVAAGGPSSEGTG